MKNRFRSVFLMILVLFCIQSKAVTILGQETNSSIKTVEANIIFEESFEKGLGDFIVEGNNGPAGDPIWKWDEWGTQDCINASMWSGTDVDINSYLVSPVMKLGRENIATFSHGVAFTISGSYAEYFGFCIREEGSTTWEELEIPTFPKSDAKISSGDIIIPETYKGKNVQVAFRYHATHAMQLSWYIKKLVVKGIPVSDTGKEYAGIEFASERVNYLFGGTDPFVAPEFKNPNNLEVTFSSSNTNVATVDATTGKVTIKALGKTIIKAESKETDKFEAGVAQYTLNVVETLEKLDAGLEWDVKELNTTFPQEAGFQQPVLKNPNNLPVVLTTSNEGVAIVDASTGIIHIQGLGIATITATSSENDEYKAGKATTTLVVTDITKVFAASFSQDNCKFTEEGTTGIWKWNDGCMMAHAENTVSATESFIVSPEMQLGVDGNFLKFEHICKNFNNPEEQVFVLVREVGTETWNAVGAMWYFKDGIEGFINSGLVRIPNSFNGKNVQLGFKYTADNSNAGEWYIRNLIVTKTIVKQDANISFDVTEVNYAMGEGTFTAPILNNPNNLEIEYMSDNYNVANINRETGEVYISGTGSCTITARSNETAEFKQGIAQYTINVTDPYLIFRDSFNEAGFGTLGNFTEEGASGCWGLSWGFATTSPWNTEMKVGDVSILVSPKMTLGKDNNTLTFDQRFMYVNHTPEKYAEVVIRTEGNEWEKVLISYPSDEATHNSGNIALPEQYNGKEVQIGFRYINQGQVNGYYGSWTINNIIVRNVAASQEKADPELSFSENTIIYDMQSGTEFVAPTLNNPHNLTINYESNNTKVASVDTLLGLVTIHENGEATITAKSEETNEYVAGNASYIIIVSNNTTGIDNIECIDMEKDVIYDLQGRKVNKLSKGIYIVNGKKIIVK